MKAAMALACLATAAAYKAAYVEHHAVSPCGEGSCGQEQNAASVQAYDAYAKEAAAQGAQIIVFPEYGITGFSSYPKQSWVSGGYSETISGAVGKVPCDDASAFAAAPSVVSLSCTARRYGIAVVANLMEYVDRKLYNTNVALDTDGTYLAKYHKRNLWGESNVDTPPVEHVTFKTSFGETFGMLVCADLIYQHPVLDLVASGVKNFVMPLAWSNEMAQMQALAYAQGWSLANGVNLILANHHGTSESGSGVLVSGVPVSQYYAPGSGAGPVRVADVQASTDRTVAPLHRLNATAMGSASWSFGALGSRVCSGAVCCEATASAGAAAGYVLAALDGTDTNSGMRWPAQVCAVLPCAQAGTSCLTFQQPTGSLTGVELSLSGASSVSIVPEVLQTGGNGGEALLTPGKALAFQATGSSATLTVAASAPLVSAIIYGRPADSAALAVMV